jgi:mannose-1-phosphate guanylyltransferase
MKAVIQCGGKGTRLRPHTSILPNPLMPIGARPVLELSSMAPTKGTRFTSRPDIWGTSFAAFAAMATNEYADQLHRSSTTRDDGSVVTLRTSDAPFPVLTRRLTDLNLNQLVSSHRRHHSTLTIATATRPTKMDFGVIDETDGCRVSREARICIRQHGYLLHGSNGLERIPSGVPFGFDDLMFQMPGRSACERVQRGLWPDIGRVKTSSRPRTSRGTNSHPRLRPRSRRKGNAARRGITPANLTFSSSAETNICFWYQSRFWGRKKKRP